MGLLERLRGREDTKRVTYKVTTSVSTEERINVVGESNYQPAIRTACNWKKGKDTLFECTAELVPEPTNKYDQNAVMVQIDGQCVGYLSRQDAKTLGPHIAECIREQGTGLCRAVIAGHADGDTDNLGVFLHLNVTRPA